MSEVPLYARHPAIETQRQWGCIRSERVSSNKGLSNRKERFSFASAHSTVGERGGVLPVETKERVGNVSKQKGNLRCSQLKVPARSSRKKSQRRRDTLVGPPKGNIYF